MDESGFEICRTCLRYSKEMQNLYKDVEIFERQEELTVFLKELTNLQCVQEDGLPVSICQECLRRLSDAISFKTMCLSSDNILRGNNEINEIKIEEILLEEPQMIPEVKANPNYQIVTRSNRGKFDLFNLKIKEEVPDVEDTEGDTNKKPPDLKNKCENGNVDTQNQEDMEVVKTEANVEVFEDEMKWWGSDGKPIENDEEEEEIPEKVTPEKLIAKKLTNSSKKAKVQKKEPKCEDPDYLPSNEKKPTNSSKKAKVQKKEEKCKRRRKRKNYNKPHMCPICGKVIMCNLKVHITTHSDERPFECAHCGKKFKNKLYLKTHIGVHKTDNPYKCTFCPEQLPTKNKLDIHVRSHTGERPFLCTICGKGFTRRSDLNIHVSSHTNERLFECEICKKTYKTKGARNIHRKTHTNQTPRFECAECGRKFFRRQLYTQHLRTHTKERPYECNFCHKTFNAPHILKRHTLLHTGEKKFKCTICPVGYIQKQDFIRHMAKHKQEEEGKNRG
ncbi:RB-associated KRAB zinc finger protein-like [Lutzomyia longipalpis]|uniref:RB-associated KRAB zinc finger protein-like n=1 Tax=Lutzomyia longipalpis TaxID=7200 RepID=UPI0024833F94|nr:RB-associated KRAB zinc finger protein-like [Lutzomyia longipalpis]